MAAMGWCPSGRLFEAAACGVPLVSDWWEGLDDFLEPNLEILIASTADQVIAALQISDAELNRIRTAARERILSRHSAEARAREFERIFENVHSKEMAAA
jgi:spore maturation protein CgeB